MDKIDDEQEDEFLFESSHLALRGNPDYLQVMRHLAVLCAKRIQVHEDIDLLSAAQHNARENPLQFVEQLRQGSLNLPQSIVVPEIPTVDFSKYNFNEKHRETPESNKQSTSQDKTQGIVYWTLDEQRKLEDLLDRFPAEAIESQRYAKIAKVMGRTPKQIASRVQKFFKKLHEANLPIPGSSSFKGPTRINKSKRQKFNLERPTTFFPERIIPSELLMPDDCDDDADDLARTENRDTTENRHERTLNLLKLVRAEKERNAAHPASTSTKIECSSCNKDLLVVSKGYDCEGTSFCGDCLVFQLLAGTGVLQQK